MKDIKNFGNILVISLALVFSTAFAIGHIGVTFGYNTQWLLVDNVKFKPMYFHVFGAIVYSFIATFAIRLYHHGINGRIALEPSDLLNVASLRNRLLTKSMLKDHLEATIKSAFELPKWKFQEESYGKWVNKLAHMITPDAVDIEFKKQILNLFPDLDTNFLTVIKANMGIEQFYVLSYLIYLENDECQWQFIIFQDIEEIPVNYLSNTKISGTSHNLKHSTFFVTFQTLHQ